MDKRNLAHSRMHNLGLSGRSFDSPEDVVGWLCAVQSQDYGPAKWSIAQRCSEVDDASLDRAFADARFLRTHVLRPTWHFVLPADIRWMLELTGPRVQTTNGHRYRELGLDTPTKRRSVTVMTRALRGGHLARKELGAVLERSGINVDGQRLPYILMNAELEGVICSGIRDGKQQTYALLDERAPKARTLAPDEALAKLTLRYFTSHGPATVKDMRWWSSLTVAQIKNGLEMVGPRLGNEVIDGTTYWFAPSTARRRPRSPRVELLQAFDEYTVGYSESKYLLALSGPPKVDPGSVPNAVVILDTQFAGHWKRTQKKDEVVIEAFLYSRLDGGARKALEAEAARYGAFLGLPPRVVTTTL